MKTIGLAIFSLLILSFSVSAQTRTINGSGNWSTSGNWLGGNIGGDVDDDDDIVMNANIDITIQNGESYTIATFNVGKDGSLTIDLGGTLTVTGTVTVDKDFTITVDGDLIIQGDMDVSKSLQLNVTGSLTVLGNLTAAKDAQIDVQGSVTVEGDFTSDKNAQVNVDGTLDVTGDLNLGTGSVILGVGDVTTGACTGAACGDSQVLPIELIYFSATTQGNKVELNWATASEENFDYFSIERSLDGHEFKEIAQVSGNGNSFQQIDYSYIDKSPALGKSYYRLRSIDFDGYTEIFDYAMVNIEERKYQANVFPNPVTSGIINVQLNFEVEDAQVLIYNNMGNIDMTLTLNSWLSTIDISSIESGSYLLKIITDKEVFIKRILIK